LYVFVFAFVFAFLPFIVLILLDRGLIHRYQLGSAKDLRAKTILLANIYAPEKWFKNISTFISLMSCTAVGFDWQEIN
jgi:hypothetical protein